MAVDPNFLAVPVGPMSWSPHVIRTAYIIARAASVVRPIANLDRDGARVTTVIRSIPTITTIVRSIPTITTIIRSITTIVGSTAVITGVGAIIVFATYRAERGGN
jgi:hypothetical protein